MNDEATPVFEAPHLVGEKISDTRAGVFRTFQPQYAAHRIATFPVDVNKRPAVRGYPRIGLRASRELAGKFADAPAFGFMCGGRRSEEHTSEIQSLTPLVCR